MFTHCQNTSYRTYALGILTLLSFVGSQVLFPIYVAAQAATADDGFGQTADFGADANDGFGQAFDFGADANDGFANFNAPGSGPSAPINSSGNGAGNLVGGLAGAAASIGACLQGGAAALATLKDKAKKVPVLPEHTAKATVGDNTKNCMLDGIAFQLKEALVKGIIQGVINFANKGFEGGPGYMTNQDNLLTNISDNNFNNFINNPDNFSSLCSAWAPDVRLALAVKYTTSAGGNRVTQISGTGTGTSQPIQGGPPEACTLDEEVDVANEFRFGQEEDNVIASNVDPDFWTDFLDSTTQTGGNALTSFFSLQERLEQEIQYEAEKKLDEVARGAGYFDDVDCVPATDSYSQIPGTFNVGGQNCTVKTAGSSIKNAVDTSMMSDLRRLELSDEFDEVFSQLVAMLIQMIIGKIGLGGVSQKSGGSQAIIDTYANEVSTEAVVKSRDDLLLLLEGYRENALEYISLKERSIEVLFQARDAVLDVYTCYFTKHNTWVSKGSGLLIPSSSVDSVPESERERATFYKRSVVGVSGGEQVVTTVYLTPSQIQEKVELYEDLLIEIGGYIQTMYSEIEAVELDAAKVAVYEQEVGVPATDQEWLEYTISSSTILDEIATEFAGTKDLVAVDAGGGRLVEIPQSLSAQQILEVYTAATESLTVYDTSLAFEQLEQMIAARAELLEGKTDETGARVPGVIEDNEECRQFEDVYQPGLIEEGDSQ